MDLFDLLIIAFLALPALLRWVGKKSRQETNGTVEPDAAASEPRGESAFERALREIGRALEEPGEVAAPRRETAPPAPRDDSAFAREDAFERRGRERVQAPVFPAAPFRKLKKASIDVSLLPEVTRRSGRPRLKRKLRQYRSSREAILLSEILGPPIAYRDRRFW